jgi:EmrB/QacA subfamily drug resistance transporter
MIDQMITNVALPTIGRDLGAGGTTLQWLVTAYVLTFAGFLLTGGRAADLFGQRLTLRLGIGIFVMASIAAGLAPNAGILIAMRAVQGLGAAIVAPATLTVLNTHFRGTARRARAFGIWAAFASGATAAGGAVGGLLTGSVGWRAIFFVNIPVGVAAMLLTRILPSRPAAERRVLRRDVGGAVLATGGLSLLAYGVVGTGQRGWSSPATAVILAGGLLLLALFVLHQRTAVTPVLPLGLFRSRAVSGANSALVLISGAWFSTGYFIGMFLQNALDLSPTRAGFALLPMSALTVAGSQVGTRLIVRVGPRPLLLVGPVLAVSGQLLLTGASARTSYFPGLILPGMITAIGMAVAILPLTMLATSVAVRNAGASAGLVNASRQVGNSLGLAVLATVAAASTTSFLRRTGQPNGIDPRHLSGAGRDALAAGYGHVFAAAAIMTAVCWLIALVALPRGRPPGRAWPARHR